MKKLIVGAALAVGVFGFAVGTRADSVTFTFGGSSTTWNGTPYPNGSSTYLTAVFTDVGAGKVDLKLTASLPVGGPQFADIDDVAFNISPFITDLTASTVAGLTTKISDDGQKISNFKQLDVLFDTGQGYAHSILEGTESVLIHLTGTKPASLTASMFDAADPNGVFAVAKIQTAYSSYESTSNGTPDLTFTPSVVGTPLPKSVWAGAALLGLIALRRKPAASITA